RAPTRSSSPRAAGTPRSTGASSWRKTWRPREDPPSDRDTARAQLEEGDNHGGRVSIEERFEVEGQPEAPRRNERPNRLTVMALPDDSVERGKGERHEYRRAARRRMKRDSLLD